MKQARGFIFDLNGTMIDDMFFHTSAWHHMINEELGKDMSFDDVRKQMYGKNEEVITRIFGADKFPPEEVKRISADKEKRYQDEYRPHLRLLPGLTEFLQHASEHDIKLAIGSAAIPTNINFVLDNLDIRHYFEVIVSADDVTRSKPDPETFSKAADRLHLDPASCIVFEDVPKGVEAALNAKMQCVVVTTMHAKDEFKNFPNVIGFIKDYTDPFCASLLQEEMITHVE